MTVTINPYVNDPVNEDIQVDGGSQLIYRQAAPLEKALADVEWQRLSAVYAELPRDQWDPYKISSRNLPYLAWAVGVNLWEDDWSDEERRWWVANQWTFKQQRGSLLGTKNFVQAVGYKLLSAIRPPATFYPSKSLTNEERQAFNMRFPQLRLYPYQPRIPLPYLCWVAKPTGTTDGTYTRNGSHLGPLRKMYPTSSDMGGKFTRAATYYEPRTDVETPLTTRLVEPVDLGVQSVTNMQDVVVPARNANYWFLDQLGKWPLPRGHAQSSNKHAIFLGADGGTAKRVVRIPTDGSLDLSEFKAIYQTIAPDMTPLYVAPDYVATIFTAGPRTLFAGGGTKKEYLTNKFLPTSVAWQYLYQRWFLFDPTRYPDLRRASVYMGQARLGIPKYTAEVKIEATSIIGKHYMRPGGFMRGYLYPPNTKVVDKVRRAVKASMALRDTVLINTAVKHVVSISDAPLADGSYYIGQYI